MTVTTNHIEADWPSEDLEKVDSCPCCGSEDRNVLHDSLEDRIFFVAPGRWTIWRCQSCSLGYLDPRPDQGSIHRAYGSYYTHEGDFEPTRRSLVSRVRSGLANDYRNHRFSTRFAPALFGGRFLVPLLPESRARIDREIRYLHLSREDETILLDVGSGNGGFLRTARDAGWSVIGVEPDPVAEELARRHGFEIHPNLEAMTPFHGRIAAITMAHVIEHVHDPLGTLRSVAKLLTPGGQLFVETPNLDAPTHARFGQAWRGLEPPRHLVLFNRSTLGDALRECGFNKLKWHDDAPGVREFMIKQSEAIAGGKDPYSGQQVGMPLDTSNRPRGANSAEQEFLTVTARKG